MYNIKIVNKGNSDMQIGAIGTGVCQYFGVLSVASRC